MRKGILVMFLLCVLVLVGCGSKEVKEDADSTSDVTIEETVEVEQPVVADEVEEAVVEEVEAEAEVAIDVTQEVAEEDAEVTVDVATDSEVTLYDMGDYTVEIPTSWMDTEVIQEPYIWFFPEMDVAPDSYIMAQFYDTEMSIGDELMSETVMEMFAVGVGEDLVSSEIIEIEGIGTCGKFVVGSEVDGVKMLLDGILFSDKDTVMHYVCLAYDSSYENIDNIDWETVINSIKLK